MRALSNLSRGEKQSSNKLSDLLTGIDKTGAAVKSGNISNNTSNKKQTGFLESLSNILSDTNRTAKKQLDVTQRIAEYEKQGLSNSEANLRANLDANNAGSDSIYGDMKDIVEMGFKAVAAIGAATGVTNAKTIEGASSRYDMAQEMRQSGLLAGMDSAGAGLINLSKTISRSNFTFGEAADFTRQFSQAVGVKGVQASLDFANRLATTGEGNSDMMRRFGMEFSEVAEIAGSYMESVRSIGQLDKLSDNQMRMGMDNFMDTVVSTSNVMKINLQDAANLIAETLKQDKFASQLALMDPAMRKSVESMVGRFGGEGSVLGEGIATAMAAGSTQDFLQTDVAQQLQGDVVGQKLLPLITQMAEAARTGGPEAANALYANMGPQFDAILQFARENKALVNLNEGLAQAIVAEIARSRQTISDADKGAVGLAKEDETINALFESQRFSKLASEANETLVLKASDLSGSLTSLVESSLILTQELAKMGAATSKLRGAGREAALNIETSFNMLSAGVMQISNALIPSSAGSELGQSVDALAAKELQGALNPDRFGVGLGDKAMTELKNKQEVFNEEGNFEKQLQQMAQQFEKSNDKENFVKEMKKVFANQKQDDSWLPGNWFNSPEVQAHNANMDKLISALNKMVGTLQ
jgi:soluble cytochrome b562